MKFYSTNNPSLRASLEEAVFQALPKDNGLYMPEQIPSLSKEFIESLPYLSFPEKAFEVAKAFLSEDIPESVLKEIVFDAVNFPAPVIELNKNLSILELFHGPSLAFKDFGARFMARIMSYLRKDHTTPLVILVATSGDTGGAVAAGFYKTPGIEVVILYPSGKVSALQEKQLTTLGHNIRAIEVNGAFDDCQDLVKQAFLDEDLRAKMDISSANSINIARLLPQIFYYFEAFGQLVKSHKKISFCVPSGNFGNLTAGLFAKRIGLPVHHFIAASNANDTFLQYILSGEYQAKPSIPTLSNAMDVGNPSNFRRIDDLYCSTWNIVKDNISAYSYSDESTEQIMKEVYSSYNYTLDPHTGVGILAANEYLNNHPDEHICVLGTAHPSKFKPDVDRILGIDTPVPDRLARLESKGKDAKLMDISYQVLKEYLLQ